MIQNQEIEQLFDDILRKISIIRDLTKDQYDVNQDQFLLDCVEQILKKHGMNLYDIADWQGWQTSSC